MKPELAAEMAGFDLVVLERARDALVTDSLNIEEAKQVRSVSEAAQHYAKCCGLAGEVQDLAAEVKVRAERRLGLLLSTMERRGRGEYPRGETSHEDTFAPSLNDLNISRSQSSRWQLIASLPDGLFESYIAKTKGSPGTLSTAGLLREARRHRARTTVDHQSSSAAGSRVVDDLPALVEAGEKFACIYADPPWSYDNKRTRGAADNHYSTMDLEDIASLPVAELAADDAHLHLWVTSSFLFEAEHVIRSWGFDYRSSFVWVKPQIGLGNYWRCSHELLLLGVRGNAPFLKHDKRSWMLEPRSQHSRKPEFLRSVIEEVSPGPFLELFARQPERGWTVWGNQVASHPRPGPLNGRDDLHATSQPELPAPRLPDQEMESHQTCATERQS